MSDDFDIDWGDDPFGGDMDFDMDFDMDPFKGKGFLRTVATGFLSGLGTETFGSGAARFRTMRTILPNSFSNALDKASFINDRLGELATEFKEENAEAAKSLQNIATHLNQRMGEKLPGFVSEGLGNFSSKDFSMWEKAEARSDQFNDRVDSTSEDDIERALDTSLNAQSGMFASLGDSLNGMTVAATGALQASIGAGNRQLVRVESALHDILSYQRNVDARIQQAQLNIGARSYVNDAKFYKFMEAGIHAEVKELKKISKYTEMSDYEKTSAYTASKKYMRDRVFNTVGKRLGGLTGLVRDKFSQENRKDAYGAFGGLINSVSDGLSMTEGSTMSRGMIGNLIGNMMAGIAVDQLPAFFKRGPGKKAIDRLTKLYPDQAGYIKEQVEKLTDVGNVISYASTSGTGMLNYMAQNYQAMDEMKYADYDDYLSQLPEGKKPIPKSVWVGLNTASNRGKEAINKLMGDTTKARGTQYSLKKRNVKDLNQPGIWKEINNITLNEVLPGLISRSNLLLEKLSGNKDAEVTSYNYMRGEFQTDSERKVSVQADLMPHGEFQRYAQASLSLVDSVDPDKMISPGARKAFALVVAKDIDAEMGFNPYYYLGDIKGMSPGNQKEVHAALKRHFGIANEDVEKFNSSDSFQRMKQMSKMPTKEGRERLNEVSANAANLKDNFPNVAERIDLLRSTGNEQMLRDLGVIYTENGIDKINIQAFHDRIGQYMDDPNNPALRDALPKKKKPGSNGGPGNLGGNPPLPPSPSPGDSPPSPAPGPGPLNDNSHLKELNESLRQLTEKLGNVGDIKPPSSENASVINFDSITGVLGEIKESNAGIFANTKHLDELMTSLVEMAASGKLLSGKPKSDTEERQEEGAKRSLMDKIKGYMPTGIMGKGMDFIMSRNPIVLGGILGAIGAGAAAKNPALSFALAAGGLAAGALVDHYQRKKKGPVTEGPAPSDDEDILDENGEPILRTAKLKAGEYLDAATKKVIKTWNDIRGPVYDVTSRAVIGARDLAGKIFGADGRAVALTGLRKVRDGLVGAYNLANPLGRLRSVIDSGKELVYQQDVYIKGQKEPTLKAAKFKAGEYFTRDESGNFKVVNGWNEIDGPVYDEEGNQLLSESDIKEGLVTASGVAVRNMGNGIAGAVGGAAGLAKSGLNKLLGRFGYSNEGEVDPAAPKSASQPKLSMAGVEHRLDLIYRMLSQHFKLPMEENGITESLRTKITGGSEDGGLRLNSLEYKKKEKEAEEKHEVNEAIIEIAKNTKNLGGDQGDGDKKKGGFFGKIKDMFISLGAFGVKLIKNPIGAIGGLIFGSLMKSTARLAKIGSALFSGVLGAASPIFKLLKWGFGKLAGGLLGGLGGRRRRGGRGVDELIGGDDFADPDQRGQGARRRRRRRGGRRGRLTSKVGRFIKGGGLAAVGSFAADKLFGNEEGDFDDGTEDLESGEQDPATGRYATTSDKAVEAATEWLPQGMLAKSLVQGVLGEEKYKELDNKGLFWTSDGSIFFDRTKRDAAQAALDGKPVVQNAAGVTKAATKLTTQKKLRFAMYGIADANSSLGRRVMALEQSMYPYLVIRDGNASLKPETPTDQLVKTFAEGGLSKSNDMSNISIWFLSRFKPVFMTYNAGVAVGRMGDITEFDNSKSYDVIEVVEKVQRSIAGLNPPPYSIDVRIDDKEATMGPEQTRDAVAKLFAELKKELPAPVKPTVKSTLQDAVKKQEEISNSKGDTPKLQAAAAAAGTAAAVAGASQTAAEANSSNPADVMTINIADMYPGKDGKLDPFTLARLAVYGNNTSTPWRLEAVLKLERYTESFIMVTGGDARFTGKSNQILELFKAGFHISDSNPLAKNNWSLWFRDRFLPTLMEYCKQVSKLRGGMPAKNWQSLSDTNRANIARSLVNLVVNVNDSHTPVWSIKSSPFPDSESNTYSDRADRYLSVLDSKAKEAKTKDPEMEEIKSAASNEGAKDKIKQDATTAEQNAKTAAIMNSVYKTGATGFASGGGGPIRNPDNSGGANAAGGYYPNATMSAPGGGAGSAGQFMGAANETFNPEFIKKAGSDKGIKMSLAQGDQLMLNHLVKAGFRDNKTLALALAMARKETGGYQSTVENTNWSAPTLLKYFKNIPDAATAQKVAAMSPVERAMYVYGRAPKGPALGNTKPEDGWDYRGRGLFQLTGKSNYEAFKKASGIDVVSHPELVSEDPNVMAESAVWFLKNNKAMKSIAGTGDFDTAVRGINGGNAVPATDERREYYNDYLNKLRNGDLTIPGGADNTEGDGAQQNDQAAIANQDPQAPAAADKNVDPTKVVKPGAVKDLLDKTSKSSAPSNAGTPPPTTNASPMSAPVTSSGPASTNTDTPVNKVTSTDTPAGTPTVGKTATPVTPTPTPAQNTGTSQKGNNSNSQSASNQSSSPDAGSQITEADVAAVKIQRESLEVLKQINNKMDRTGNSLVKM